LLVNLFGVFLGFWGALEEDPGLDVDQGRRPNEVEYFPGNGMPVYPLHESKPLDNMAYDFFK